MRGTSSAISIDEAFQSIKLFANNPITFASHILQLLPVENLHVATAVPDQSGLLKCAGNQADAGTMHAEHVSEIDFAASNNRGISARDERIIG